YSERRRSASRLRCTRPVIGPSGGGGPSICAIAKPEPPTMTAAPKSRAIFVFLDRVITISAGKYERSIRFVLVGTLSEQKGIVAKCTVNIRPDTLAKGGICAGLPAGPN